MDRGDTKLAAAGWSNPIIDIINSKNLPGVCDIRGDGARIKREDKKSNPGW
jgi:hypothetical protein